MAHKRAVIAATGIAGLAVCLGAAAAINGGNLGNGFDDMDFGMFDGKPRCEAVAGATATSRDIAWDGSDHAGLSVHATASYAPGANGMVHAAGDPQVIAHLRVKDGNIEMDCRGWRSRQDNLAITLPGRTFRKFSLAGDGRINLDRLAQDDLKIEIAGVGTIRASGKVDTLDIEMAGVGKADFGAVTARNVKLEMAGVGKADIAPQDEAKIDIAGPGEVTLHSNPKHLDTEIAGPGRIRKVADGS